MVRSGVRSARKVALQARVQETEAIICYDKRQRHGLRIPLKHEAGYRFSGYMSITQLLRWLDGYEQGLRDARPPAGGTPNA